MLSFDEWEILSDKHYVSSGRHKLILLGQSESLHHWKHTME